MMIMRSFLTIALLVTISTPSFAGINTVIETSGQYWQRVHISSALYLTGPKAQQILHRDIARCVVELRELERLGAVKDAIPEYAEGLVLSEDEAKLAGWDTPERDDELFSEHSEYHDFEGCMLAKGWERIKFVPYDVAYKARENYKDSHVDYKKTKKRIRAAKKYKSDYSNLND